MTIKRIIKRLLNLLSSSLITLSILLDCIVSTQQLNVVSSAYIINWKFLLAFGKSLIFIINRRGPRIDPCGTPYSVSSTSEQEDSNGTYCFLLVRYELSRLYEMPFIP